MLILESPRPNGRSSLYLSHMPGLTFPVTRHFLYDIASANILARLRPSGMVDWLLRHARRLTPGVGAVAYLTSVNGEQVEQFAQASSYWRLTVSYTHLRAHETRHDLVC